MLKRTLIAVLETEYREILTLAYITNADVSVLSICLNLVPYEVKCLLEPF